MTDVLAHVFHIYNLKTFHFLPFQSFGLYNFSWTIDCMQFFYVITKYEMLRIQNTIHHISTPFIQPYNKSRLQFHFMRTLPWTLQQLKIKISQQRKCGQVCNLNGKDSKTNKKEAFSTEVQRLWQWLVVIILIYYRTNHHLVLHLFIYINYSYSCYTKRNERARTEQLVHYIPINTLCIKLCQQRSSRVFHEIFTLIAVLPREESVW